MLNQKLITKKIVALAKPLFAAAVFFFPLVMLAAPSGGPTTSFANPLKGTFSSIPCLILALLEIATRFGAYFLVVMIVWVGFSFVLAQGKPDKLKQTREAFMWTMIGAFIVLGTFVISKVVQDTVSQFGNAPAGSQTTNSCKPNSN